MLILKRAALLFVLLTLLVGCGGKATGVAPTSAVAPASSGGNAATASNSSSTLGPSAAEIEAVAQQVYAGEYPMGCSPRNRPTCPMTDRLADRFAELSQPNAHRPGPPNWWCGCQNPASRAINIDAVATAGGGIAHVTLYPDVNPIKLNLIVVRQAGELLVDDIQYTGRAGTVSIYAPQSTASGS
jgi:hypothetical protein